LVVNTSVTVSISLADHIFDLLLGELLSQRLHDLTQLRGLDVTITVLVKDLEGLTDLLIVVKSLHFVGHHGKELVEVCRERD
jgi:hypothetical protein